MTAKFHTEVKIPDYGWKTGYKSKMMLMGSCFTENIGNKLLALKYPVDVNPFGILYNPVSIAQDIRLMLEDKQFEKEDLIHHDGLWHSFHHHGKFSSADADIMLDEINKGIENSSSFLKNADFLFLSFGTAWVYENKATGMTVANCHKIPNNEFRRFRLTPGEIIEDYRQLISELWKVNPELKIIFTVSPVRHWKDGAVENQRSKSTLLLSVEGLIRGFGEENCNYFPSYEIMMDELRDYRFYDEDMIHLSASAINHIWERFQESLIEKEGIKISEDVQKVQLALNHRPRNMYSQEHLTFLRKCLNSTQQLQEKYPYINLTTETKQISDAINNIIDKMKHG